MAIRLSGTWIAPVLVAHSANSGTRWRGAVHPSNTVSSLPHLAAKADSAATSIVVARSPRPLGLVGRVRGSLMAISRPNGISLLPSEQGERPNRVPNTDGADPSLTSIPSVLMPYIGGVGVCRQTCRVRAPGWSRTSGPASPGNALPGRRSAPPASAWPRSVDRSPPAVESPRRRSHAVLTAG
jgi:hypothetical protein